MINKSKLGTILILVLFFSFLAPNSANASIEEFKNDSLFITTKGNIPEDISQEWITSIDDSWLHLTKNKPYSQIDILVVSFGRTDNYLMVDLDSTYQEEIDDNRIDSIYQKIEDYCRHNSGVSEIPIIFMWTETDYASSFPDLGSSTFDKAKSTDGFLEARGIVPDITESGKKREWYELLYANAPVSKIEPYMVHNGGHVNSFGCSWDGYLEVGFDKPVSESVIDEIYGTIDTHYELIDISNIPVVFIVEGEIIAEEGYDSCEANQIPGFSALLLFLGLLLLVKIKR